MRKCFAAILLSICSFAQAFTIDFNQLANGQSPGEAYAQYGVHITGGTVLNGQVAGAFTMTFDPGFDVLRLNFEYAKVNEGYSIIHSDRYGVDSEYRDSTLNPYCNTQASCDARGMRYISANQLFPDRFNFEQGMGVTRITLANAWTDNLVFTMAPVAAAGLPATAEVPEPSTLFLLTFGLIVVGWHYQRRFQLINQQA